MTSEEHNKYLAFAFLAHGAIQALCLMIGMALPIRETAHGYIGKHGSPHTSEEYHQYELWVKLVMVSFGVAFLTGFGAITADKISQRRNRVS